MLIAGATDIDGAPIDVRIEGARVTAVGQIAPQPGEAVIEARGRLLLPGLHDHHIHLLALAASRASVVAGPPAVVDREGLAAALSRPGDGWLRATGYHESVAGLLDRAMLDAMAPHRPVRVQHRSGRMWFLNTPALDRLRATGSAPPGLDVEAGRLFDADDWLRARLGSTPPSLAATGVELAAAGVTGVTDMTPRNDPAIAAHFGRERAAGALPQQIRLAGTVSLGTVPLPTGVTLGEVKLHLHEADLPDHDDAIALVRAAHAQGRAAAVHCATEVELVFALAAIDTAGAVRGDRIEHASVAPDSAIEEIARLGLAVVSQPHFIAERGDAYRADLEPDEHPFLYRLQAFRDAGVTLAGGSDAPFGRPDPWASMAAAVSRRSASGASIGGGEALSPEAALALYLADPADLGRRRSVAPGTPADLCLVDRPWSAARTALDDVEAAATWIDGRLVHDRIDQPPVERGRDRDAAT